MVRRIVMSVASVVVLASACSSATIGGDAVPTTVTDEATESAPTVAAAATNTPEAPTPPPPEPTRTEPAEPTPTEATTQVDATATVVNVYWLRDLEIVAGGRHVDAQSPARAAVEALLRGPLAPERALGMQTLLAEGVELLGLTISDGVATVDVSPSFEDVSYRAAGELAMLAQVVFTLTQFPSVDSVDFRIDGIDREFIVSDGIDPRGHTREDYFDILAPAIVVERPIPFEDVQVSAPLAVAGFSRTFESNVQWELTSPPGATVIASGFTTARQPDVGKHGPFEFTIDLSGVPTGRAQLSVYEESAQDGRRVNVYDVAVTLSGDHEPAAAGAALPWLRVNGIGQVNFGATAAQVEAAFIDTFGPPDDIVELAECGVGPITQYVWEEMFLLFGESDTFDGWFYRASTPAMTTPSGVTPGLSREDLLAIYDGVWIGEDTLGPEFFFEVPAGFIGGFLTDDGATVTSLYAGSTCFFR